MNRINRMMLSILFALMLVNIYAWRGSFQYGRIGDFFLKMANTVSFVMLCVSTAWLFYLRS